MDMLMSDKLTRRHVRVVAIAALGLHIASFYFIVCPTSREHSSVSQELNNKSSSYPIDGAYHE